MQALVILNPAANHTQASTLWPRLRAILAPLKADWVETEGRGHATRLAADAARAGCELVVAVGGDGTVNEVANGLMVAANGKTAMGVIPSGSGNDFAFSFGLPADPETAARRILEGRSRTMDVGHVQAETPQGKRSLYYVNGFGIGFDAAVAIESDKVTLVHGFLRYLVAALQTMVFYYRAPQMSVTIDGRAFDKPILLFSINNGRRVGGGFFLTPEATPDDGWLDLCYAGPVNQAIMLRMMPEAMQGTHGRFPYFTLERARHVTIQADRALPVYADGEIFADYADDLRCLEVHLVPGALKVIQ
jgi:YegS/Rv2252/BmrU family lipid kinase